MDRNLIYAIIATSVIILFFSSPLYQRIFGKEDYSPVDRTSTTETQIPAEKPDLRIQPDTAVELSSPSSDQVDPRADVEIAADIAIQTNPPEERRVTLENDDVSFVLNTRGGVIAEAHMKKHSGPEQDSNAQLIAPGSTWYDGVITDGEREIPFTNIVFTPEIISGEHIILTADIIGAGTVRREFTLGKTGYMVNTSTSLDGNWSDPKIKFSFQGALNTTESAYRQIRIWPFTMFMRDEANMYDEAVFMGHGDRLIMENGKEKAKRIFAKEGGQKIQPKKDIHGEEFFSGDLNWYAMKNKYFMLAAIPRDSSRWQTVTSYQNTPSGRVYDFSMEKRASEGTIELSLYTGPASYTELQSYGHDLTKSIDLSWKILRPLSIVFIWMFRQIHSIIPNWGFVLIIFSVIIKFVLYPLSKSSMNSMKKMSSLQPRITALKEKYKDNPQKM